MLDHAAERDRAKHFVRQHLLECVQELLDWQSRGALKENGRVRELAGIVEAWDSLDSHQVAESLITRAALNALVHQAGNLAGEDVCHQPQVSTVARNAHYAPAHALAPGFYWWRESANHRPVVVEVTDDGTVKFCGSDDCSFLPSTGRERALVGGEFAGPLQAPVPVA